MFPKILLAPVAFFILVAFLLAKPFVQIRLYRLIEESIGILAFNSEINRLRSLIENKKKKRRIVIVYCSANKFCSNIALRKLFFRDSFHFQSHLGWLVLQISALVPIFRPMLLESKTLLIDFDGLLVEGLPTLRFSRGELRKGHEFLRLHQVNPDKFVCLHVRDSDYLTKTSGPRPKFDFRNSEISTYFEAAEALAEMGYTVFRMGAIVKEPLISKHPRVIDYATNGMRSEFLDVFLGAHCTFCISTGSGWDSVPTIFRRPIMFVNHLPIFGPTAITIPITLYPKSLGDEGLSISLSFTELIQKNIATLFNSAAYADAGVEIRDLSSEELVEAVTEMAQRVEGTFVETPEQKEMQAKLKHILSTHPKLQPTPNHYPIRAEFASCFLSRYPNFLD